MLGALLLAAVIATTTVSSPLLQRVEPVLSRSPGSHDGVWRIVPGESFVGYRVREKLTFLPAPNDAVGRTSAIVGSAAVAGRRLSSTIISTDLRTLTSDRRRRDGCVRGRLGDRPRASFRQTTALNLPAVPEGQIFSVSAPGDLRVHGVTRHVVFPLRMRWTSDRLQVIGTLRVRFSWFKIASPKVGPVVSVGKTAKIEVQLSFAHD